MVPTRRRCRALPAHVTTQHYMGFAVLGHESGPHGSQPVGQPANCWPQTRTARRTSFVQAPPDEIVEALPPEMVGTPAHRVIPGCCRSYEGMLDDPTEALSAIAGPCRHRADDVREEYDNGVAAMQKAAGAIGDIIGTDFDDGSMVTRMTRPS